MINGKKKEVKNITGFILVFALILPIFGSINSPQVAFAQVQPENLTDVFNKAWQALPSGLKKIWNEEILPKWYQIKIWLNKEKSKNRGGVELKKEKKNLEEELSKIKNSFGEIFKQKIFKKIETQIPDILK